MSFEVLNGFDLNFFEGGQNLTQGGIRDPQGRHLAKVLFDVINNANLRSIDSVATAGGAATENDLSFPGLQADDLILAVHQRTAGAGLGKNFIAWSDQKAGSLDVTWDDDPGAGAIVRLLVLRPLP